MRNILVGLVVVFVLVTNTTDVPQTDTNLQELITLSELARERKRVSHEPVVIQWSNN